MLEDDVGYRVDGEIGRLSFACHLVLRDGLVVLDTSREVFPSLSGKEWYRTLGFKEIAIVEGALLGSYRQTSRRLDRLRHQGTITPLRTTQDVLEREGLAAAQALEHEAERVLEDNGLDPRTLKPSKPRAVAPALCLAPSVIEEAVEAVAPDEETARVMRNNPVRYEHPSTAVNVSIDDVLTKKQKEHRRREPEPEAPPEENESSADDEERKRVHITVAHVEVGQDKHLFAACDLLSTCRLVLACLAANGQLGGTWTFFVDGLTSLQDTLLRLFAWVGTMQLILDWFHLAKKCRERLSSAMNNRHERNAVLKPLLRRLWYGDVDGAIAIVRGIDARFIKDSGAQEKLIGYFERNRPYIPCYAVRKQLGLRNSSNVGEKANDRLVSTRQKHNGMAWSETGSVALATLQSLVCNGMVGRWFQERKVDLRWAA